MPSLFPDDDNNSPGSAIEPDGQGESLPTWLLALVVVLSVSVTALVVACCWWCCWPAKEDVEEGVDIGLKSTKSMFDTVYKTRGMGAKSMMKVRTRASNFSTRFRSAFKSFMKNGDGNSVVDITERYTIPGTDGKTYTAEELMKGRLNNWTGDPDRDAGALPQSQRSRWALPFRG